MRSPLTLRVKLQGNDVVSKLLMLLPVLLASPALAESKKDSADPNKKICKYERETSSRIVSKRICMTRAEWDEQARQAAEVMEKRNRVSMGANRPN